MTDNKEEEDFGDNCLIEDEPEDGDDGLEVDMGDITKQCEGMEPKVKARDAKNQRQKFDSASYEMDKQEKKEKKEDQK